MLVCMSRYCSEFLWTLVFLALLAAGLPWLWYSFCPDELMTRRYIVYAPGHRYLARDVYVNGTRTSCRVTLMSGREIDIAGSFSWQEISSLRTSQDLLKGCER